MKKLIALILMYLCSCSIQGHNINNSLKMDTISIQVHNIKDSLKIDTIMLHHGFIIIKLPANFHKKESPLEYGGLSVYYASQPPISIISVMKAANSEMYVSENCTITDTIKSEDFYSEKGVCPLKGYFRNDYKTDIIISYANVSECEHSLFDYILDSVIINKW